MLHLQLIYSFCGCSYSWVKSPGSARRHWTLPYLEHRKSLLRPGVIKQQKVYPIWWCYMLIFPAAGDVYIDGVEKPTKLPALTRGSVLSFDTVVLPDGDKVRVTIEVNERIVTFDWSPRETRKSTAESPISLGGFPFPAPGSEKDKNMYFAIRFHHKDWKISVEWTLKKLRICDYFFILQSVVL